MPNPKCHKQDIIDRIAVDADNLLAGVVPNVEAQVHTDWTDGHSSIQEVALVAEREGIDVLVYSEHSGSKSERWFPAFASAVRAEAACHPNMMTLVGTEVRISSLDGNLAIEHRVRAEVDLILASVHRFPSPTGVPMEFSEFDSSRAVTTELSLMLAALGRGGFDILAHPFGMSLCRFNQEISDEEWLTVMAAARNAGILFELNSKYHVDLKHVVSLAAKAGALLTLGSDAHAAEEVGTCRNRLRALREGA